MLHNIRRKNKIIENAWRYNITAEIPEAKQSKLKQYIAENADEIAEAVKDDTFISRYFE